MSINVLVITHGEDVDGIVSATVLDKTLEDKHDAAKVYFFAKNSDLKGVLESIALKGKLYSKIKLFILDLPAKEYLKTKNSENISLAERLVSNFDSVIWIDHHDETRFNREYLVSVGIRTITGKDRICTAGLVYKKYARSDPVLYYLSRVAQANDYPEESGVPIMREFGVKIQELITSFRFFYKDPSVKLEKLVFDLRFFPFVFSKSFPRSYMYKRELKKFRKSCRKAFIELERNLLLVRFKTRKGEMRVLAGHASGILPAKMTTAKILEKYRDSGVDGVMINFGEPVNNVFFFVCPEVSLDISGFCRFMGGGGREKAGGFPADAFGDIKDVNDLAKNAAEKMKNFFKE
jgi:oligoribonuclease NrnB/cAMP/cGMP phosphodiesterase (DHH superfamily)